VDLEGGFDWLIIPIFIPSYKRDRVHMEKNPIHFVFYLRLDFEKKRQIVKEYY